MFDIQIGRLNYNYLKLLGVAAVEKVKRYIYQQVAEKKLSVSDAKSMLMDIQKYSDNVTEDIAIIGMACRFPMADNTKEFWNNLVNGVESIRAFPDIRRKDTDCRLKKKCRRT